MLKRTGILLAAAVSGVAHAHELPDGTPPVEQALHHALSLHHLPALVLLAIALVLLYRASRKGTE